MTHKISYRRLGWSLVPPLLTAIIGSSVTFRQIDGWYASLVKPVWTPPGWLFGPVWTVLYLLIGLGLYLYWQKAGDDVSKGLAPLIWQLIFNALWSIVFFGLHSLGWSLIVILFLLVATVWNIYAWRDSRSAVYCLLPYLLWICFATWLNLNIAVLN